MMTFDLEKYLIERLASLQEEAEQKKVVPAYTTKDELFKAINKDVRAVLNKLFQEKKIRVHKTVHAPIKDFVELVKDSDNE